MKLSIAYRKGLNDYSRYGLDYDKSPYDKRSLDHQEYMDGMSEAWRRNRGDGSTALSDRQALAESKRQAEEERLIESLEKREELIRIRAAKYRRAKEGF